VSVLAGNARAEPKTQSALAEQAYQEGRELAEQNRWDEACAKFEDSLRHEGALGTQLNLARGYEHIGKLASAWQLFTAVSAAAVGPGNADRRAFAQNHAAALEPRVPRLAVIGPTPRLAGFAVAVDGAPIDADGRILRVNPGARRIVASAPDHQPFTRVVSLVEGGTETVVIPDLVLRVAAPSSRWTPSTYAALTSGAVGVAAAGVGLWFGARALSTLNEAKALCGEQLRCASENYDRGKQLSHDVHTSATASTVLVIAGGAAIAAGAAIWLTAPSTHEHPTAQLAPVIHDRGAGLAIVGAF
jgi:hypothetical protein